MNAPSNAPALPDGTHYLGDGAYIRPGNYAGEYVIFTWNGLGATNAVVLDPYVAEALYHYLDQARRAVHDAGDQE